MNDHKRKADPAKCKHDFEEIFNSSEHTHSPVKVCGICGGGFDVKKEIWYTSKQVGQIKSKLLFFKEEQRGSRGRSRSENRAR